MNDAEIEQFSKEHGFAAWYRVSAKEGTQVRILLIVMLTSLMALMNDDHVVIIAAWYRVSAKEGS